ncbi:MAG TPA: DUF4198 domain-containing protein [Gemmataceae bacterium]|jgi:hypothetical protein|nr:DUF4198 domain-containing protein [Gemmataceae bacterium]
MRLFAIAFLIACCGPTFGHDLWLIPPEKADTGRTLTVRAHSGSEFPVSEHAPDPAKFARRIVISPEGESALDAAGIEAEAGLLAFRPSKPGVYVVAVETSPKLITLEADKFNAYLVEDSLPHIYALRSKEKSLDRPGTERYSKSPKALVRAGDGKGIDFAKPVGLPLEIVPLKDPFERKVGDTLPVRVLFQGKALADAHLGWATPGDGALPRGTVRTNAAGEALIPMAKAGLMTIRLTHMTRPKAKDYEWESFWTTLTWYVPN